MKKEFIKILTALFGGKTAFDGGWKEEDHKRDQDGKFTSGSGSEKNSRPSHGDVNESEMFAQDLEKSLSGELSSAKPLRMGNTSKAMQLAGADDLPVVMSQRKAKEVMQETDHGLSKETLLSIPKQLHNPIMILDSSTQAGSMVVVTELFDKDGKPVVAAVHLNKKYGRMEVNEVASIYGRSNAGAFIAREIGSGKLRYVDKTRSSAWSRELSGLQLPAVMQHAKRLDGKKIQTQKDLVNKDCASDRLSFDRTTQRSFDENGFLRVAMSPISKEAVNEYYGYEIPGWQEHGLEPNKIYKGYRPGEELKKAAASFNGLNILSEHVKDDAEDPPKDLIVGSMGTDAAFSAPYLKNSLFIKDAAAIRSLDPKNPEETPKREISASYRYDPVFTSGTFNGERYDFVMTNIRGNHIALVEEGRAGKDVVVADANRTKTKGKEMEGNSIIEQLKKLLAALTGAGVEPHPGGEEEAKTFMGDEDNSAIPAESNADPVEDDEAGDLGTKLFALIDGLEDQELAAKLKALVDQARGEAPVGDEDKTEESDEESKKEEKPAMDEKNKGSVVINMATDEKAVAAKVRKELQDQMAAARDVRPLIGDLDPMAFDSATAIYQKALELAGHPTKVSNLEALREMCQLACDAKPSAVYPVITDLVANDGKGDEDPNFANIGRIRRA